MRLQFIATSVVALAFASAVHAQDKISTDRPGITFSPVVLPPGVFQVEAGLPQFTLARSHGIDTELWSIPILLRYGVTPSIELRLAGVPWNRLHDDATGDDVDGASDIELGTKLALTDGGSGPALAAIFGLRLPAGSVDFTSHQAGYTFDLAASLALGTQDTLTGLAGISCMPAGDENETTGALGLALAHSFTDTAFSAYLEAGWFPEIEDTVGTSVAGAGITCLASKDVQLDAFVDFGLDENTPDAVMGLGISWRL